MEWRIREETKMKYYWKMKNRDVGCSWSWNDSSIPHNELLRWNCEAWKVSPFSASPCFDCPGWVSWPLLINWFCLTFLCGACCVKKEEEESIDTNWDLVSSRLITKAKNFREDKLNTRDQSSSNTEQFVNHLFIRSGNICLFAAPYRSLLSTTRHNFRQPSCEHISRQAV